MLLAPFVYVPTLSEDVMAKITMSGRKYVGGTIGDMRGAICLCLYRN